MTENATGQNFYGDNVEPIAIIGTACRHPGEASSMEGFWEMMSNGRNENSEVPSDRFNADAWYHPSHERRGAINAKNGFFISEDVSLFDAPFFSITAKEAAGMDPMQRLLLEVAYECFENAGVPMQKLPGSATSVYCGSMTNDYELLSTHDIYNMAHNAGSGNGRALLSNRLSWFFDLRGPSITLDTACSSSLYGLHLACQSLRLGETKMALITGANLILYPNFMSRLSSMHMMSPEGISHTFDERANGYGRGEAINAIIIKPLKAALADGDTIRAVIRGTGANQDGKTPGITMPSGQAQADLIRTVYTEAGLSFEDTGYFEAHGTGTGIGDPTELSAIGATFGAARSSEQTPLYVGSVKSNIGHTEGASGLASVLKTVLCLEKGFLPPIAGFETLNPKLRLKDWKIALPLTTMAWPTSGQRRASVNSFGFGGANAHIIIDDAFHYLHYRGLVGNHQTTVDDDLGSDSGVSVGALTPTSDSEKLTRKSRLLTFSSHDQAGLQRMSRTYLQFVQKQIDHSKQLDTCETEAKQLKYLEDLAYTLASRRSLFDYRSYAVVNSMTGFKTILENGLPKAKRASKHDNVIFVFTGQGAEWPEMGKQLLDHNPTFRQSMTRNQAYLESFGCTWDVFEELEKTTESRLNAPEFSQPICTAIQIALVDMLLHWGVKPKATVGHSSGEMGAAYAAGALSQEDAIKISYFRGLYAQDVNNRLKDRSGAMMAAGISEEDAQAYLNQVPENSVVVACVNSPSSLTLSGDESSISHLEKVLQYDGKFARKLRVTTAYHSPHMKVIADDYFQSMGTIAAGQGGNHPSVPMFSSVTTELIDPKELDASYWVKNMVQTVRFAGAVKTLLSYSPNSRGRRRKALVNWSAMVELGPHEALKGPLNQIMAAVGDGSLSSTITYTSMLFRGQDAENTAIGAAGLLWSQGHSIDLLKINHHLSHEIADLKVLSDLPAYPWNHSTGFWHDVSTSARLRELPRTDLLGVPVENQNSLEPRWKNYLRIPENPWMADHEITGTTLYPGAGMIIMVIEAAAQMADKSKTLNGFAFRDINFERGLVIPSADETIETSLSISPHKTLETWYDFTVFSLPGGSWVKHCYGSFSIVYDEVSSEIETVSEATASWKSQTSTFEDIKKNAINKVDPPTFYKDLKAIGMGYGPIFTNVAEAAAVPGQQAGYGTVVIPDTKSIMPHQYEFPHLIHPATMDAIFHLFFVAYAEGSALKEAAVPVTMESMFISADLPAGAGAKYLGYSKVTRKVGEREAAGDIVISDESWTKPKIVIQNFTVRQVSSGSSGSDSSSGSGAPKRCGQMIWNDDIDYLKGTKARELLKGESCGAKTTSNFGIAIAQLSTWLEMACYKETDLEVLIVGSETSPEVLNIMRKFAPKSKQRFRFSQCTLTEPAQPALDAVQQELETEELDVKYQVLDLEGPAEQMPEPACFDLLLVDTTHQADSDIQKTVSVIGPMLRAGGRLALVGLNSSVKGGEIGWHSVCETAGLETMDIYIENKDTALIIASHQDKNQALLKFNEIVLLKRAECSAAVLSLEEKLSLQLISQGFKVQSSSLLDFGDVKDKAVISLLELEKPLVAKWSKDEFDSFRRLVATTTYLMWITRGGQMIGSDAVDFGPTTGLLRTARLEMPQITMPHLDLSPTIDLVAETTLDLILSTFHQSTTENPKAKNNEMEFVETNGRVLIPRVMDDESFDRELELYSDTIRPILSPLRHDDRPLKLAMGSSGVLDSLRWVNDEEAAEPLSEEDVEIRTIAVSLNATDIRTLLGKSSCSSIGREAAGVITKIGSKVSRFTLGQTVVVLKEHSCRTHIRQHQSLIQDLFPAINLSPVIAASLPTVLITAYHALVEVARIRKGESLLVHSAAGGFGQAAIQVAQHIGVNLFVTVGSKEKKELLIQTYGIAEDHIFDSRNKTFDAGLLRMTEGKGINVVISASSGEIRDKLCSCIANFGRFIDISEEADFVAAGYSAPPLRRNVAFSSIDMAHMMKEDGTRVSELFQQTFDMIRGGSLTGVLSPTTLISVSEIESAVRLMQTGDHSGKVVLTLDEDVIVPMLPPKPPQLEMDPQATYVLSGGLGALGLSIAETMFEHGARHIVFLSRSGATTKEQLQALSHFQARGCNAEAIKCDVTNKVQMEHFIEKSKQNNWQIKGAVQCAMVLRDSILENMDYEKWLQSTGPKINGTWNLHSMLPKDLDFFVILSSLISVIGNTGQANYAAGNSYEDSLARLRQMNGLAAVSVNVGLVSDAMHFNDASTIEEYLDKYAHLIRVQISDKELNIVLAAAMRGKTADGVPVPAQLIAGMNDNLQRESNATSLWPQDRKFDHRIEESMESSSGNKVELKDSLKAAKSIVEATKVVENALKNLVATAMTASPDDIDVDKPLHTFGVDSLKAVEIRNWIFRELKCEVSVFDILSPMPVSKLSGKIASKSKLISAEVAKETAEEGLDE